MRTLEERLIKDVKAERYYRVSMDSQQIVTSAISASNCDIVCAYQDEDSCIGYEDALIACASPEEVEEIAHSVCFDIDAHSFEIHPIDTEGKTLYACSWKEHISKNREGSWLESMHVLGVAHGEIARVGLSIGDMKQDLAEAYAERKVFCEPNFSKFLEEYGTFEAASDISQLKEDLIKAIEKYTILDIDYLQSDIAGEIYSNNSETENFCDVFCDFVAVKVQKEDGQEWLYTLDEGDAMKEVFKAIEKRPVTQEVIEALEDLKAYID